MINRFSPALIFVAISFAVLGAACTKQTPVTQSGTNTVANAVVNSRTFSTNTNSAIVSNGITETVTVSSAGVTPAKLTIRSGTTVVFINTDSVSHQISSDPHPSHTDLPGFDGLMAAGANYHFVFTKTGTFGYHDHLNPVDSKYFGSVTVQ